jgi:hypothetical protein
MYDSHLPWARHVDRDASSVQSGLARRPGPALHQVSHLDLAFLWRRGPHGIREDDATAADVGYDSYGRMALSTGAGRDHPWRNPLSPTARPGAATCAGVRGLEADIQHGRNMALHKAGKSMEQAIASNLQWGCPLKCTASTPQVEPTGLAQNSPCGVGRCGL